MQSYNYLLKKAVIINQNRVRLARSDALNRMFHHVESPRINCFNFKLALVLLRRTFFAFAYLNPKDLT